VGRFVWWGVDGVTVKRWDGLIRVFMFVMAFLGRWRIEMGSGILGSGVFRMLFDLVVYPFSSSTFC
jgi:hypothetical protein